MVLTKKYRIVIRNGICIFEREQDFGTSTTHVGVGCDGCAEFDNLADYNAFIIANNIVFETEEETEIDPININ